MEGEVRGISLVLVCFGLSQLQCKCDYALLFGFRTDIKAWLFCKDSLVQIKMA